MSIFLLTGALVIVCLQKLAALNKKVRFKNTFVNLFLSNVQYRQSVNFLSSQKNFMLYCNCKANDAGLVYGIVY